MKRYSYALLSFTVLGSLQLTSCDTPTGQGAGIGAATGAIIGAASGALIGAAVEQDEARRYGPPPEGGYPVARFSDTPGLVISPYPPHRLVDVRGIPHGAMVRDPST